MRATLTGSLPGEDFRGALRAMAEAFPALTPLPELPARGIGSAMVGRALGLIEDLGFDVQPSGWRLTSSSNADHRRARARWRQDLDDAEEVLQGFKGTLKVGITGPWTLASSVQRPRGDVLLADHGARREVAEALRAGVDVLVDDLSGRLPLIEVLVQVDEPALMAVAGGAVPTSSGFSRHRAVDRSELVEALQPWFRRPAVLHCCAPGDWLPLARQAGCRTAAVDGSLFDSVAGRRALEGWLQEGGLHLGVVDARGTTAQATDQVVRRTISLLGDLDVDHRALADALVLSSGCGLAGWQANQVMRQIEALRDAVPLVAEQLAA